MIKRRYIIMTDYGLKPVVSYTTRDMRANETEGVEHYFITPEVAKEKLETEHILAYTKIGDIEYFATIEALNDSNLYIIDPKGIKYLKENFRNLKTKVIYIMTDNELRMERARKRDNKDFIKSFEKRNAEENEQFTQFEESKGWDLLLLNNSDGNDCIEDFYYYVLSVQTDDIKNMRESGTLFLVAGRTGSGKDYITRHVIKKFELQSPVD